MKMIYTLVLMLAGCAHSPVSGRAPASDAATCAAVSPATGMATTQIEGTIPLYQMFDAGGMRFLTTDYQGCGSAGYGFEGVRGYVLAAEVKRECRVVKSGIQLDTVSDASSLPVYKMAGEQKSRFLTPDLDACTGAGFVIIGPAGYLKP